MRVFSRPTIITTAYELFPHNTCRSILSRVQNTINCGTIGGIRFCVGGCDGATVRGFLCSFGRETHTKDLRDRFPAKSEEDEKRQGLKVEQKKAVNIRGQSIEVGGS